MTTVSASLRMFDQMTRPLQQVTQALNLTISAMDNMNNAANRDIRITNSLNAARGVMQSVGAELQSLTTAQNAATNSQNQLNNSFNRGSNSAGGLSGKIKGLIGTYFGFQAIRKGIDLTIGGASRLEQQLITISGMLGNKDVGKQFFGSLNDYANISVYGLKEFSGITRQFIQFTKNTDKLMNLNKTAERLAFLDPTQGLEGAGFALKEALGGDFMSLKGRFGFGSADREILQSAKSMDDFINKFNKLLDKKGATEQALKEFNNSAIAQFNNLKSNIETAFSQAGNNALEILKPVLSAINQGFREGRFQPFFNSITNGIVTIVNISMTLIESFNKIAEVVSDNWGIIGPILAGAIGAVVTLKGAVIAYNIVQGISNGIKAIGAAYSQIKANATLAEAAATEITTGAQVGLNIALLACPLMWIVIGIVAVIAAITAWSIHTNGLKVTWLIFTNFLLTAWDSIQINAVILVNKILQCYNAILIGTAKLNIGVQNALGNMKAGGLMILQGFVNGAIDLINDLINRANKIPGVSIEAIQHVTFGAEAMAQNEIAKSARNKILNDYIAEKDMAMKKRQDTLNNMVNKANADLAKRQANIAAAKKEHANGSDAFKLNNILDGLGSNLNKWNNSQTDNFGDLGQNAKGANSHLKNIDNKMDVSNEHLKMLRDVAERDYVAKFTTQTLAPNVKIEFGDVKETVDSKKVAGIITKIIKEEIAALPEGV